VTIISERPHDRRYEPSRSAADGAPAAGSDAALLAACRDGDADAWDTLVVRYERLVFSVALRNGLDREDAADVTQDVFVALLKALHTLQHGEKLASWLMTVARRAAWRLNSAPGRRSTPSADTDLDDGHDPVEDWTSVSTLHSAVGQMGDPCSTLIRQLYLDADQPSYAEIAARMGRSIGGIGPLRGRCLERLRELVGEDFR
jgi:RNA polymerase sigma factor (sigma-70 family)